MGTSCFMAGVSVGASGKLLLPSGKGGMLFCGSVLVLVVVFCCAGGLPMVPGFITGAPGTGGAPDFAGGAGDRPLTIPLPGDGVPSGATGLPGFLIVGCLPGNRFERPPLWGFISPGREPPGCNFFRPCG